MNTGNVLLGRGLRIRVKTIGGFLQFLRQVAHCVFHCAIHFFANIVHNYRVSIRVRVSVNVKLQASIT